MKNMIRLDLRLAEHEIADRLGQPRAQSVRTLNRS